MTIEQDCEAVGVSNPTLARILTCLLSRLEALEQNKSHVLDDPISANTFGQQEVERAIFIYKEAPEIEKAVWEFAQEMVDKLRENSHKRGWKEMLPHEIMQRILEEAGELVESIGNIMVSKKTIEGEAVDVANFAMFMWYRAHRDDVVR